MMTAPIGGVDIKYANLYRRGRWQLPFQWCWEKVTRMQDCPEVIYWEAVSGKHPLAVYPGTQVPWLKVDSGSTHSKFHLLSSNSTKFVPVGYSSRLHPRVSHA
jgi:hypothetical protein